jgi:hypothetical protein
LARVNTLDASVRHRAPKDGGVQHAFDVKVVDVSASPAKKPAVLLSLHWRAGEALHVLDL